MVVDNSKFPGLRPNKAKIALDASSTVNSDSKIKRATQNANDVKNDVLSARIIEHEEIVLHTKEEWKYSNRTNFSDPAYAGDNRNGKRRLKRANHTFLCDKLKK